jgi:diaminopimelate decarboxylase
MSGIEEVLRHSVAAGLLGEDRPIAGYVDMAGVRATIGSLQQAFPDHFEHAFAAKANTMSAALRLARQAGMGCEAASPGELEQALKAGFSPRQIVYDEPAKTFGTLRRVLSEGVALNIDNFQEFARVRDLLEEIDTTSAIGFRINPQVGAGSIGPMSTAVPGSKFGVALEDAGNREALLRCYREHPWLSTLHCHVGSQGCPLDLMAAGVRRVVELAGLINDDVGAPQVRLIDIGGGLPVNFEDDEVRPGFAEYAGVLRREVPELFTGGFRVKTEFGRSIFAKNGFIVARVEYTKEAGGRRIAVCHAGAQVAARTVFMPEHWPLRISVFDAGGGRKEGGSVIQDVAGPCCFAGDVVAAGRELPLIEPGDYVVLHDTGAYYFSMPFYYNAIPAPAVYGIAAGPAGGVELSVWREPQRPGDMLSMLG